MTPLAPQEPNASVVPLGALCRYGGRRLGGLVPLRLVPHIVKIMPVVRFEK
jgi:hypothetical protein